MNIGQPFADEIFRVFPLSHPDIVLQVMSANKNVSKMIAYTYAQAKDD